MKVLLIGNYVHNQQPSMDRFSELLRGLYVGHGHDAHLLQPTAVFGQLSPGAEGLGKWLGYIDRFLLFGSQLRREVEWADVVHICDQANSVYAPRLMGKPHLVTCHDMFAIRSALGEIPANPTGWTGRIFQRWILSSLRKAQRVVCVSEQTCRELISVAGLAPERTAVVPNALNYPFRPMPAEDCRVRLRELGATEPVPFFAHVGGNQWYKNRAGVVRIFAHLAALPQFAEHHLILAGKPWSRELRLLIDHVGLAERVREWVDISNEELRALYSAADALIFPSLREGFGWPIVEAQACGCPVFTSDRAPMTEVGADAAAYFDPGDPQGAARVVAERIADAAAMSRRGLENAKRFSSASMLAGYLSALDEVVKERASVVEPSNRSAT
jgi:glycosyltransferase involved in cell wall biosynthesis